MAPPSTTPAPRTIRVGLLICGTLSGPVEATHGGYTEVYTHYWNTTQPPNCNANVVIDSYNIKKMNFPDEERIHEYDIFMVTGSATSAFDDSIPWVAKLYGFLKHLINDHPEVRLCGICFGHQIVCRALGGTCGPNGQWEIGPTTVDLTDVGRAIFGVEKLSLQEMHRDHVLVESFAKELASGEIQLVGSTGVTKNQGMIKFYPSHLGAGKDVHRTARDIHVLTLQGHPEFSESIVTGIIRQRADAMGEVTVTSYWGNKGGDYDETPETEEDTGRRWMKTDGLDVVGKVLWKMLGTVTADIPDDHEHEKHTFMTKPQQVHELPGAVARVDSKGSSGSGWFMMSGLSRLVSNLIWNVFGRVRWW